MSKAIHIGYGAFHRAHQAVYLQRLANAGEAWPITAINLRAPDAPQFNIEAGKTGYEVETFDAEGKSETLKVDRHQTFLDWSADAQTAEAAMADPAVTFVTITVSEAGYYFNRHAKLDTAHPAIAAEASGGARTTIYGYLSAALAARQRADAGPINILCCDNLRDNGHILENNFKAYLKYFKQTELLKWIEANCCFPCSMVDRITPAPTTRATEGDALGTKIVAESFIQWVVEDTFCAPRPSLETVGVEVVADVVPFEETKIRVLNGGHTALAYLGALQGHEKFDGAMEDADLRDHFSRFERVEVQRAMSDKMPVDVPEYISLIEERFTNKSIGDSIERICMDGFAKFGIFIRPTLEGCFDAGQVPAFTIRSIAAWFHYACMVKDGARDYKYFEPNWDTLSPLLNRADPSAFLTTARLFGSATQRPEFAAEFKRQLSYVEQTWPV